MAEAGVELTGRGGITRVPPTGVVSASDKEQWIRVRLVQNQEGNWVFDKSVHEEATIRVSKGQVVNVYSVEAPFWVRPSLAPEKPWPRRWEYPFENLHDHENAYKLHQLGPAIPEAACNRDGTPGEAEWKMTYETEHDVWDPHIVIKP